MKQSKFTEHQIVGILRQHEAGVKVVDLCREHGISNLTFCGCQAESARNKGMVYDRSSFCVLICDYVRNGCSTFTMRSR